MKIIAYEDNYRDDLIFMILEAKNALRRVSGLNSDLLDIKKNYMNMVICSGWQSMKMTR